ncbi:MAG: heavy metal translocating P-type ATPase [Halobacteriaceae archaeon]
MSGDPGGAAADGCALCGLPLSRDPVTDADGKAFCCPGCRDVHASLDDVAAVDEGDVRAAVDEGETGLAADPGDEPPSGHDRTYLQVDGMHCATCEAFVETVADGTEGVADADSSYVTETVRVDYDPDAVSEPDLAEALTTAGYTASLRDDARGPAADDGGIPWRVAVGAMLAMYVMLPYVVYVYPAHFSVLYPEPMVEMVRQQLDQARYFYVVVFFFTTLVLGYTGRPLLRGAYVSLTTGRPNMDLLVSLAAGGAYLYSTLAVLLGRIDIYYDVTVAIVVVVTAGNYYESRIKRRATDRLSDLTAARVDAARRYREDGTTESVAVEALDPGDRVLVRNGERVPVDGTLVEGPCTVDEAVVTGESRPAVKQSGDDVVGGSIVVDDAAVVEVGPAARSSLDRVVDLVWNLQSADRGVQQLANKLAVIFVPAVVALAAGAGVLHLALGASPTAALLGALTVLIVSCPCALGLATPLAVAAGIRDALQRGIVVFDETVFERLRQVDVVAFDKTGTLTTGEMTVLDADAPEDLLAAAAALERRSAHPAAAAIAEAFGAGASTGDGGPTTADGAPRPDGGPGGNGDGETRADGGVATSSDDPATDGADPVDSFESHPTGVEGVVDGTKVLVGHPDLFEKRGWTLPDPVTDQAEAARDGGDLPVVVGRDGAAEGVVVVGDEPREEWAEAVAALDDQGVDVVVLTGDEASAAAHFREHADVDEVFAGVPPAGKAATVRRLGRGRQVAMVGDGTNDAPALAEADLGVAMGGGTALAADAADVAVIDDDLSSLETVFDVAEAAGRRVKQNVAWAFLYNGVAIPLAITGHLNPLFAAAAMVTSSLLVVTNSARDLVD